LKLLKNIGSILFVVIFSFSLVACQGTSQENSEPSNENNGTETADNAIEAVTVTISKNNGEETLETKEVEIEEGQTVMDVMNEYFELETAFDNTFITGINGTVADEAKKESWFYSVNGEEAMVGATEYKLNPGDKVEFDLHQWE